MLQLVLKSNDGEEFRVEEDVLFHSHLFKTMLIDLGIGDGNPPSEALTLTAVNGWTLQKIIDWCSRHKDVRELDEEENPRVELTDEEDAILDVTDGQLLDILLGANYLDIPDLVDAVTQKIADMTQKMSAEQLLQLFDLEHDEEKKQPAERQWYDS